MEALREIAILSALHHPNMIAVHAVAHDATLRQWFLVMELATYELTLLIRGAKHQPFTEGQVKL